MTIQNDAVAKKTQYSLSLQQWQISATERLMPE